MAAVATGALRIVAHVVQWTQGRVAHFIRELIIILSIGDVTDGHGVIGREGLTDIFLTNPFTFRAECNRCVLDTGSIKVRIAEGPLCRLSAIVLLHFTVTYQGFRKFPYARIVRPRGSLIRSRARDLLRSLLRRQLRKALLFKIVDRLLRRNIAARGDACVESKLPVARWRRLLMEPPSRREITAGYPVGAGATQLIRCKLGKAEAHRDQSP